MLRFLVHDVQGHEGILGSCGANLSVVALKFPHPTL
jgi:hypothetical protein